MPQINAYLNFKGNCEEAFNFYRSVFGGEFPFVGRYKDMPPTEGKPMPAEDAEKIMHMSLPIGNGSVLMGSDVGGAWADYAVEGNNVQLSVNADSAGDAQKIFDGLADGGRINMPLEKTFWSELFGMLTDKFGINWMVSYEKEKMA